MLKNLSVLLILIGFISIVYSASIQQPAVIVDEDLQKQQQQQQQPQHVSVIFRNTTASSGTHNEVDEEEVRTLSKAMPCRNRQIGERLRHPENDHKFLRCVSQDSFWIETCPDGLFYNDELDLCDWSVKSLTTTVRTDVVKFRPVLFKGNKTFDVQPNGSDRSRPSAVRVQSGHLVLNSNSNDNLPLETVTSFFSGKNGGGIVTDGIISNNDVLSSGGAVEQHQEIIQRPASKFVGGVEESDEVTGNNNLVRNGIQGVVIPTTTVAPTTTTIRFVPTTTEFVPTTTPFVPTTTHFVPTTTQFVPTTTQFVPTTTRFVPTTTQFVPTTTQFVPTTTRFVPTTTQFVPTTTHFVPTTTSQFVPSPQPQPQPSLNSGATAAAAGAFSVFQQQQIHQQQLQQEQQLQLQQFQQFQQQQQLAQQQQQRLLANPLGQFAVASQFGSAFRPQQQPFTGQQQHF